MREIRFRYTDHRAYTLVGSLLSISFLWGGVGVVHLAKDTIQPLTASLGDMGVRAIPYILLIGICLLVGIWQLLRLSHIINRRIFDKWGTARFYPDHVEICKGDRTFSQPYKDIVLSHVDITLDQHEIEQVSGPRYLRLTVAANGERMQIGASVQETEAAWGGFGVNWKRSPGRPRTSLEDMMEELSNRIKKAIAALS